MAWSTTIGERMGCCDCGCAEQPAIEAESRASGTRRRAEGAFLLEEHIVDVLAKAFLVKDAGVAPGDAGAREVRLITERVAQGAVLPLLQRHRAGRRARFRVLVGAGAGENRHATSAD